MIIEISNDGDSVKWSYCNSVWRQKDIDELIRFYEKYEDIEAVSDTESKISTGKAISVLKGVLSGKDECHGCDRYEDYIDTSITCEECMRAVANMAIRALKEKV